MADAVTRDAVTKDAVTKANILLMYNVYFRPPILERADVAGTQP